MDMNVLAFLDKVTFAQTSGDKPDVLFAGGSAGEYGIGLAQLRFADGAFAKGISSHHLLIFHLSTATRIFCRINNKSLDHVAQPGNVSVCPADVEFSAESSGAMNALLCAIPREPLAHLSAEHAKPGAALPEKLSGCDHYLLGVARDLANEVADGFSNGPRYWTELTETLLLHLFEEYVRVGATARRGTLTADTLVRINAYVREHLDEPVDVDMIADLVAKGRTHFPRIFRRSVGMSPYQYLVHLRLKHAQRMMRLGEMTLAEVAAATGFVDQSHLCRWIKRVYGTSPARLAAVPREPHEKAEISKTLSVPVG
jgi:AraC family transcriptional regulator